MDAEEMDAEMEATRMDTSGGEASAEDVATRAAPRHAIRDPPATPFPSPHPPPPPSPLSQSLRHPLLSLDLLTLPPLSPPLSLSLTYTAFFLTHGFPSLSLSQVAARRGDQRLRATASNFGTASSTSSYGGGSDDLKHDLIDGGSGDVAQVLIVKGKDMLIVGCGMSGITSILAMTASGSTTMRISQL
ncbi:uncharacterized protein LOC112885181 [Panicum hallii]|uniref:uncharacterized protein LOC112885181 n=1 Tax=Panicum hallii TaxID=206008 RepID=UPI000DF4DA2D|nr:uncharacterized protein LOC112885181 [Panicum hallii]